MAKTLSPSAQINLLKRLRRACPFAVLSGPYGYTCGGLVGGVKYATGMYGRSQVARYCQLSCYELRKQAFKNGYDITLSIRQINNAI